MKTRQSAIDIGKEEFKKLGHKLIDQIADFLDTIRERPVTTIASTKQLQQLLGNGPLPENGASAQDILIEAADLLFNNSLFNGHPKFSGYITSSAAPLGALADLLAAAVNPNVGANILSPMATEIEKQTIRWLAELIGVAPSYGGIMVSGGNMANFTAFLAARTIKAPKIIKEDGISNSVMKLTVYCSRTTHTWVEKASVFFGLGSKAIRWIQTDTDQKMDNKSLEETIKNDLKIGCTPIMVIGTAGDVSTGAVDDLNGIAVICKTYNLWFHVDGAYGIPAAILPELKFLFEGIAEADSIALDPHKWLYSPLEAGCTLVKDPNHLLETYSSNPVYYNFNSNTSTLNYFEYGLQNSRGFRALKVWTILRQVGRTGYIKLINEDIKLSQYLYQLAESHPELEAITQNLSITTLRYTPLNDRDHPYYDEKYLNDLNKTLLNNLQAGGKAFLSNAVIIGKYCLRSCIVNFRTTNKDIEEIIEIIVSEGRNIHSQPIKLT